MFKIQYVIIYILSMILLFFWLLQHITFENVKLGDSDPILDTDYGYFLHITDVHLDSNYTSGATLKSACHNLSSSYDDSEQLSKTFGTSGCDSPIVLAQKTMDWIKKEWKDKLDFVVWTGDNVRHDWDKTIKRDRSSVYKTNQLMATMMHDTLGSIPVIPSLGNNDVVPHNQMIDGDLDKNTNQLLKYYFDLWQDWIPQDQHDQFQLQGSFIHTVAPHLKVLSLNTMYFIKKNERSDGCKHYGSAKKQMNWFEQQLSLAKKNGDKVLVIGHVPPTEEYKQSCFSDYIQIASTYSDIIIGHLYGHLNKDHFLLYDASQLQPEQEQNSIKKKDNDDNKINVNRQYAYHYRNKIRDTLQQQQTFKFKVKIPKFARQLHKMYAKLDPQLLSNKHHNDPSHFTENSPVIAIQVNPSVLPKYYPTLRIYRYNKKNTTNNVDFGKIKDYQQYFANITQWDQEYTTSLSSSSSSSPTYEYQLLYSTLKDYGMKELTAESFFNFAKKMVNPKDKSEANLWKDYVNNIFIRSELYF
ncbi:unnamed protein product [Cunninghamella echinulata]